MLNIAKNINILGNFCGKRDLSALTSEQLESRYGIPQADVMVLFGGSILAGGDVFADAIRNKVAKKYVIVGGAGHTTETLRQKVHLEYPEIETAGLSEAEVFQKYVKDDVLIINYAAYSVKVTHNGTELVYEDEPHGMWDMERYVNLLMGEIPRLSDDKNGYGPNGKGFIAHVDIPSEVRNAFDALCEVYSVREANPLYASKI